MTSPRPVTLVALGLAIGAAFHAADVLRHGWWPYQFGPSGFRMFWNALLPLDLTVIALLAWKRRVGLVAACALMTADVAVNGYAWRVLGYDAFAAAVPIQVGFSLFVLIVTCRYLAGGPFTTG
ncbi:MULTISPECIES: hypothetical protein [unclassified Sphingomonas]|uniref:hypothetical protein n=1 Tax=unclassified Sphingomonas TaxID=196159 RepID=UPI00161AD94E|nr:MULTISPECIES: hypothetical protein [unclassified Sphingomonas]MBB3346687.1 hypothetical protein [Sphingomonas sp. BK069]MBB3472996.1 hypothetical protein [Sphingomonas sp. BK345]